MEIINWGFFLNPCKFFFTNVRAGEAFLDEEIAVLSEEGSGLPREGLNSWQHGIQRVVAGLLPCSARAAGTPGLREKGWGKET